MKIDFRLPTTQSISKSILLAILITTSFYCAGQQAPSGGPPDTTPPKIIVTYPLAGSLRYHDNKFSFSFSKYIDRRSLQESFFVSPSLGPLTFEWDGTDVEISFTDSLRSNTTYIVTLGTDVTDTRKNRLAEAFTLPFSTGDRIDSALIAGKVVDDKPIGVMIFAYHLDSHDPDTLNPSKLKPDYLTQTGKDGSFILPYLAYGKYRLFAIRDEYKNLLYDVQTDQYGAWNSDIVLSQLFPFVSGIQFKMAIEDTTPPFLSSVKPIDDSHLLFKFSEQMDASSASIDSISIIDTLSNTELEVDDLSFDPSSMKDAQVVTARQEFGRPLRVTLHGFKDGFGNKIQYPQNIANFNTSSEKDTTVPTFEIKGIGNNSKNIPVDDSLHIIFSEGIVKKIFENGFTLTDSIAKKVDGQFDWKSSREVYYVPTSLLTMGMYYTIKIVLDSIVDFSGNFKKDSTFIRKFETVTEKVLSSISGKVSDDRKDGVGKIYLFASNVAKKDSKVKTIVIDSTGYFKFDHLLEGKYTIAGFRDTDSNKIYTYGKPFPFSPAERFIVYPDTLKLRARWPLEGLMLQFKK